MQQPKSHLTMHLGLFSAAVRIHTSPGPTGEKALSELMAEKTGVPLQVLYGKNYLFFLSGKNVAK